MTDFTFGLSLAVNVVLLVVVFRLEARAERAARQALTPHAAAALDSFDDLKTKGTQS